MNWNYWLPWRDYPQVESKDSSYEDEVIERCDHEWSDWEKDDDTPIRPELDQSSKWYSPPRIENGHLVFTCIVEKTRYCKMCGNPNGPRLFPDGRVAIELDYHLDGDVTLTEALGESNEEPGRVLVNKAEQ